MQKESDPAARIASQVLRLRAFIPKRLNQYLKGVDLRLTGNGFLQLEYALHLFTRECSDYYKHTEVIDAVRTLLNRTRQLVKSSRMFKIRESYIEVLPGSEELVLNLKQARAGLKACTEIRDIGWIGGDVIKHVIEQFKRLVRACHRIEDANLDLSQDRANSGIV